MLSNLASEDKKRLQPAKWKCKALWDILAPVAVGHLVQPPAQNTSSYNRQLYKYKFQNPCQPFCQCLVTLTLKILLLVPHVKTRG